MVRLISCLPDSNRNLVGKYVKVSGNWLVGELTYPTSPWEIGRYAFLFFFFFLFFSFFFLLCMGDVIARHCFFLLSPPPPLFNTYVPFCPYSNKAFQARSQCCTFLGPKFCVALRDLRALRWSAKGVPPHS